MIVCSFSVVGLFYVRIGNEVTGPCCWAMPRSVTLTPRATVRYLGNERVETIRGVTLLRSAMRQWLRVPRRWFRAPRGGELVAWDSTVGPERGVGVGPVLDEVLPDPAARPHRDAPRFARPWRRQTDVSDRR
jgi:hypothetical protein